MDSDTEACRNTHKCSTPMLSALICDLCRGEWQEGRHRGKCPLGVLIMAPLLPLAVTIPRGGQDKRKAMFHLGCLGISNSKGSKRRETAGCYIGRRRGNQVTLPFSLSFILFASSAAVFEISRLNKSILMASRQEKRQNLITVTVLFNELKASGSDLLFLYYFVVERYMWQNGAGRVREWGWTLLLRKSSVALAIVFVIYTFLKAHLGFHPALPGEHYSAATEPRVSETPWQVGRHRDSLLLIIDGNKLHSLDVWQGNPRWMWIQMCLWMCECLCALRGKKTMARKKNSI